MPGRDDAHMLVTLYKLGLHHIGPHRSGGLRQITSVHGMLCLYEYKGRRKDDVAVFSLYRPICGNTSSL